MDLMQFLLLWEEVLEKKQQLDFFEVILVEIGYLCCVPYITQNYNMLRLVDIGLEQAIWTNTAPSGVC